MCERFAQVWDEELGWYVRRWTRAQEAVFEAMERQTGKAYNVSPADPIGVVVGPPARSALEWVSWGIPLGDGQAINTPLEGALTEPAWRQLLDARAAVPMTGFYEWAAADGQPFFFHRRDGGPVMVAAVLRRSDGGPCASLLTGPAAPDAADVQGRLPLVLRADDVEAWLDPVLDLEDAAALVATPRAGVLEHYPVRHEVLDVRSAGPGLVEPLGVAPRPGS